MSKRARETVSQKNVLEIIERFQNEVKAESEDSSCFVNFMDAYVTVRKAVSEAMEPGSSKSFKETLEELSPTFSRIFFNRLAIERMMKEMEQYEEELKRRAKEEVSESKRQRVGH